MAIMINGDAVLELMIGPNDIEYYWGFAIIWRARLLVLRPLSLPPFSFPLPPFSRSHEP